MAYFPRTGAFALARNRNISVYSPDGVLQATLEGHTNTIVALAVQGSGGVVSGSGDRTARVSHPSQLLSEVTCENKVFGVCVFFNLNPYKHMANNTQISTSQLARNHATSMGFSRQEHITSTDAGLTGVPLPTPPIGFTLPPPTVLRLAPIPQDGRGLSPPPLSPSPPSPRPTTDAALKLWRVKKKASKYLF